MNLKKWICVFLALALCAAVFAACAKTPANEPEQTTAADDTSDKETADDDAVIDIPEADRTTANFSGTYVSGNCTIVAEAVDESTLKFSVRWEFSDAQSNEWEMSGAFDPDTLRVNYSDCVCKTIYSPEDGAVTEQVEYENGVGRMQFADMHSLVWNDEQGNVGLGLTFTDDTPQD